MNTYELVEFFGVLPVVNKDYCYESFQIERNGLILEFILFYTVGYDVSILHKATSATIFSTGFEGNFRIERRTFKNDYDCLELTVPYMHSYGEINWNYTNTLRIFIEPNIKVEILR